jgi:NAD(P)-dependent dehydrogenase (short-subunit alcohol dehydrogenase family)
MNFQGKTIVITGASSGIGAETARYLRLQGARVIGMDRNEPLITLDGFVKADLSEEAAIDAAFKQLPEQFDALCNVAGVPGTAPVDLVARVNYLGLRHLCERALERLPQGGAIVNGDFLPILLQSGWVVIWMACQGEHFPATRIHDEDSASGRPQCFFCYLLEGAVNG